MPAYGDYEATRRCVDALRPQLTRHRRAIVVDDASPDAKLRKLVRNMIPGDPVIAAIPSYNADLFAISQKGRWIRFPEKSIAGAGSLVMELPKGDAIAGLVPLNQDRDLIFVSADGGVFTTLGFGENGVAIAARDCALHVNPGTMHRTCDTAGILWIGLAHVPDFTLQLAGKPRTLQRKFVEDALQLRVVDPFG